MFIGGVPFLIFIIPCRLTAPHSFRIFPYISHYWGIFPFRHLLPNLLASYQLPVGELFPFHHFLPNLLASHKLPVGEFSPFRYFLPNLLASYQLPIGEFFLFHHFLPNLLASHKLPVGEFSPFRYLLPNLPCTGSCICILPLGCFSLSDTFYPTCLLPISFHWGVFPFPLLSTQPACFPKASGWGTFPIPPLSTQSSLHMHSSIGEFCAISHFLPNPH